MLVNTEASTVRAFATTLVTVKRVFLGEILDWFLKKDFCRQAVPRSHHALAEGEVTQVTPQCFLLQLPGLSPQSRGVSHLKEKSLD